MHVARLEEYLSKSELEPLESAIKEPRKFASDVVCQDCLYDALHTSSLRRDLQFKTQPMQGACACRRHPRCRCHACFGVPVKLQNGCFETKCACGRAGQAFADARTKNVLPTALQLRLVAVRRIKQVYAAPTNPWRPLVVKLLRHDRAEPLQEGAPLDAALQAWENTTSTTGVHADRMQLIRVSLWRWFVMQTVPGWQAASACPVTGPACFAPRNS